MVEKNFTGESTKTYLFAYGTLMSGLGNHRYLQSEKFIGKATTQEKYAMFIAGPPFVHPTEQRTHILGEVWEVGPEALAKIDRLEQHPTWYVRTPIKVKYEDDVCGPEVVEIYFNSGVSDR